MKKFYFVFLFALFCGSNSAFSGSEFKSHVTSGLCVSFYENNAWERSVFTAYCNLILIHYSHHLVVTNPPKVSPSQLSPLRKNLIADFFQKSEQVDLFIFGHTNDASNWFRREFASKMEGKLRLVYNSGCTDGKESDGRDWSKTARTFVGHKGNNFGAIYTPHFLRNWFNGYAVSEAATRANTKLSNPEYFSDGNDPRGYVYGDSSLQYR